MSEALYERYKDALRRGHVAALRGRLDQAAVAYGEAAAIAPERALPHSSLGRTLLRLGRAEDALAAFAAALDRAPADEAALGGRAEALAALGRRAEAADAYDALSLVLDEAGRMADALDMARRAIELAESRSRRRHLESLARRLREAEPDDTGRAALERALAVLEGTALGEVPRGAQAAEAESEEALPVEEPPPVDLEALAEEAEAALDGGDLALGRQRLLALARARSDAGQADAALDACAMALATDPSDPDVHLTIVGLYLARGWRPLAVEKLVLLARLVELTGDDATRSRLRDLVGREFPAEPRLAALIA